MSSAASPRLSPGHRFADRYEIHALLGAGGMGAVYRATDLALGEPVALKILAPQNGLSPVSVLRFRQEVRLARRVTHPNVVRVFDIGEQDGVLFLTMEIVEGETLSALLRREGRLPALAAMRVGAAIAEGLAAAHAAGVIHRDLKPSNVVLTPSGRVAITDFGIARSLIDDSDLTVDGAVVGTPRYMAPEQRAGEPLVQATDVFTLGLLLQEMLTGARPDPEIDGPATILGEAALLGPAVLIEGLKSLLRRCLFRHPAGRPSAADVARALRALHDAWPGEDMPTEQRGVDSSAMTAVEPAAAHAAAAHVSAPLAGPIAVLPFQHVGPPDTAYLGGTIAAELVDTLAQIRGLKVFGTGATGAFARARDPVALGSALGASMILDGSIQIAPDGRARLSARLLDGRAGVQRWSVRHEGVVSDLFSFQVSIARVIAERLRLELTVIPYEGGVAPEAIELYLAARRDARTRDPDLLLSAIERFERCLAVAPRFPPAASGLAMTTARVWFYDRTAEIDRDWEAHATRNLERALAEAPDLAETQVAAGMHAVQSQDLPAASRALRRALGLAPTCVDALEYSGMLLCETGGLDAAFERLGLVVELDPTRAFPLIYMGRAHALSGGDEAALAMYSKAEVIDPRALFATSLARIRLAAWRGERDLVHLRPSALSQVDTGRWALVRLYLRALEGALDEGAARAEAARLIAASPSPRSRTSYRQFIAEIWLVLGKPEMAIAELSQAADDGLFDVDWVERCSLLDPLRSLPAFQSVHRQVMKRAASVVL